MANTVNRVVFDEKLYADMREGFKASDEEIEAAGGLEAWMAKKAQEPTKPIPELNPLKNRQTISAQL